MAQPPLEYQIDHADRILVCSTLPEGYQVERALKGKIPSPFKPDVGIFTLLGYDRVIGERVVMILVGDQVIELLPVKEGKLVYAPTDSSVRRELDFNELVALV